MVSDPLVFFVHATPKGEEIFMSQSILLSRLSPCALTAALALLLPACAVQAPEEMDSDEPLEVAGQASVTSQCVAYRRGVSGTVADTTIWQSSPTYNNSANILINTGISAAGFRQALLYFDISNIPSGVHVDSAVLYLSELYKDTGSTVDVHEVLAPWSESTVTWNSFGGAFDPTPSTSFYAWGGGVHQIHVEALVQSWVDGNSENHGLLLQEHEVSSEFRSSEHSTEDVRPRLKVCYSANP
jgi:hypothetical protein